MLLQFMLFGLVGIVGICMIAAGLLLELRRVKDVGCPTAARKTKRTQEGVK